MVFTYKGEDVAGTHPPFRPRSTGSATSWSARPARSRSGQGSAEELPWANA
ncbi:MAG: hypothetical protein MZW92_10545 [Comamonadaceae bacterium]|nr:hypothetical protein [Comamonadaceae bacterium]